MGEKRAWVFAEVLWKSRRFDLAMEESFRKGFIDYRLGFVLQGLERGKTRCCTRTPLSFKVQTQPAVCVHLLT